MSFYFSNVRKISIRYLSGLQYTRGESHKLEIDEDQPMQKHYFGQNLIDLIGEKSQQKDGFGRIVAMDLSEGDFTLDGQVKLGDSLDQVLAAWPILEDRCDEITGSNPEAEGYLQVYPDTLVLTFREGKLVQIHIQEFMD